MKLLAVHPSALMYTRIFLRLEPLGLELIAGCARWTELRGLQNLVGVARWTWPLCLVAIGLLLVSYREA